MTELVNQPTAAPTRKVAAPALAGAIVTGAVGIATVIWPQFAVFLSDPTIVMGLTVALTTLVGYLTKEAA